MTESKYIFIISDSLGETAQALAKAGTCQFPQSINWQIKRIPYVTNLDVLSDVLEEARCYNAFVLFSLVDETLAVFTNSYCQNHQLLSLDLMSDLLSMLGQQTNMKPIREAGLIRQLNRSYFERIEAIEFAVKHDDGKDPRGFLQADVVLLGVSRTSKTPLSIYLANKHLKVANLPLVPEVPLPQEIFEVDSKRIIGLTNSPETLNRIRTERLKSIGLKASTSYSRLDRILEELDYADQIMKNLKCPVIDVENRSIEETSIIILNKLRENGLDISHVIGL